MSPPLIRRRHDADLDECVAVLAEVHRLDGYPMNWPVDPRRWLCEPRPTRAWVAVDAASAIVGHIAVHRVAAPAQGRSARPTAEVARLFVSPAARGTGLGGALLARARQWATDSATDLVLEVAVGDTAAVALYERTGWHHTGTRTASWTAPDGSSVSVRHFTVRPELSDAQGRLAP
ncbi:GNAT family N-acetyltransferase [Micromonospora sp. WMMD1120]|uniref:GNAT family N-acetyltransferase n=1 Tax=Micromonospora sp. WMMD1120 TaxID=3016106 RepID=UPI0024179DAA|nr:GNAT family N-acetyltransferase [Micromonospora sp. WMMD1120]MDG4809749.1 GNAT family N-acetyltransferase [Micromonospora sp. WMMD1120]